MAANSSYDSVALAGALAEAALGCPIFPVRAPVFTDNGPICSCKDGAACGGPEGKNVGKHPHIKQWPEKATTDPAQIDRWARQWPDCNWGGATGERAGRIVIEIDPRAGGDDGLHELERELGPLPETRLYRSGSGGLHHVFAYPPELDRRISNSAGELALGVDVRGAGGFGVLPGSQHKNGNPYALVDDLPIAALPEAWLGALLEVEKKRGTTSRSTSPDTSQIITEGRRNDTLHREAGLLRHFGWDADTIFEAMLVYNRRYCQPPLSESEVRTLSTSAGRYVPAAQEAHERVRALEARVCELEAQLSADTDERVRLLTARATKAETGENEAKALLFADAQIRRNPGLGAAKPLVGALPNFIASLAEHQEPDAEGLYRVRRAALAESAGMSEKAVGRHIQTLAKAGALLTRTVRVPGPPGQPPWWELRIGYPSGCDSPAQFRTLLARLTLDTNYGGKREPLRCRECGADLEAHGASYQVTRTVTCGQCGVTFSDETTVHWTDANGDHHATPKTDPIPDPPGLTNPPPVASAESDVPRADDPGHDAPTSEATAGGGDAPWAHFGSTSNVVTRSTQFGSRAGQSPTLSAALQVGGAP